MIEGAHLHPVGERGERHDDEVGPVDLLLLHQVGDQRDGLDGLAQAHLVGQDAVQVVVVEGDEPLEALDLVGLQRAAHQDRRLRVHALLDAMRRAVEGAGALVGRLVLVVFHLREGNGANQNLCCYIGKGYRYYKAKIGNKF